LQVVHAGGSRLGSGLGLSQAGRGGDPLLRQAGFLRRGGGGAGGGLLLRRLFRCSRLFGGLDLPAGRPLLRRRRGRSENEYDGRQAAGPQPGKSSPSP
jgi:hypothetical protein